MSNLQNQNSTMPVTVGSPASNSQLSPTERAEFINDLVKHGAIKSEEAEVLRVAHGVQQDTRTQQEKAYDAMFGSPVSPDQYHFNTGIALRDAPPEVVAKMNGEYAQWSADLKLPPYMASAIVEENLSAITREKSMNAAEIAAWADNQQRIFEKVHGPSANELADQASDALKQKSGRDVNVRNLIRTNGATMATMLIAHAQRLAKRG